MEKIFNLSCSKLTDFMRSINVFGKKDFVTEYDDFKITDIIKDARFNGYDIDVKIKANHYGYLYVRYVENEYCKTCLVFALNTKEDFNGIFNMSKLANDHSKELNDICFLQQ